jgi:hypothetical protein
MLKGTFLGAQCISWLGLAMLLVSCDADLARSEKATIDVSENGTDEPGPKVLSEPKFPKLAVRFLETQARPDGRIRIQKAGKLHVGERTLLCFLEPKSELNGSGVNVPKWANLEAVRSHLGPNRLRLADGSERIRFWRHGDCSGKDVIIVSHLTLPNREGGAYRLAIVAWQGKRTAWVGSLERLADPKLAETWGPMNPVHIPPATMAPSIDFAGQQLLKSFTDEAFAS